MRKRECGPDGVAEPAAASRTPEAPGPETRGLWAEGALHTGAPGPLSSGDPAASTIALVARTGNAVGSLDTTIELWNLQDQKYRILRLEVGRVFHTKAHFLPSSGDPAASRPTTLTFARSRLSEHSG